MQKLFPVLKALLAGCVVFLAIVVIVNLAFGKNSAAAQMLIPLACGVFAFVFIGRINWAAAECPDCATQQPFWRKPTSLRQFMWGGWTCANCGTEIDRHGKTIDATPSVR